MHDLLTILLIILNDLIEVSYINEVYCKYLRFYWALMHEFHKGHLDDLL